MSARPAARRKRGRGPTPKKPTPRHLDGIPGTVEPGYREREIIELALSRDLVEMWRAAGHHPGDYQLRHYAMGPCNVLVGREPAGSNGELLWHLTISAPSRHPTWDEIKTARYRLLPADLTFGMLLPPADQYVNVEAQDHVFHLWETTDPREPSQQETLL